jgi:hypothetical protein
MEENFQQSGGKGELRPLALSWAQWLIVALGISTLAAPSHATLISIEPDNFAPGQDISDAVAGVRISAVSRMADGTIVTSAVFAHEFPASCTPSPGMPTCAATGQKVFTHDVPPLGAFNLWGEVEDAREHYQRGQGDTTSFRTVLRLDFLAPTDHVDVLGAFWENGGVGIAAFNAAGQFVGECIRGGVPATEPGDCRSVFSPDAIGPNGRSGWYRSTIETSIADISFVLIGGAGNYRQLDQIRFAIPEPATSGLLALGMAGLLLSRRRRS